MCEIPAVLRYIIIASWNDYKILAIRLLYLYSESGTLKHQGATAS